MHILTISSERSAFLDEACGGNQDIRHAARTVLILDANARMSVPKNVPLIGRADRQFWP